MRPISWSPSNPLQSSCCCVRLLDMLARQTIRTGRDIWSETITVCLKVLSFGNCSTLYLPQPILGQRRPILLVQPDFLQLCSGLPHLAFRTFAGTRRAIFRFWDHKPSIGEAVPEGEQTNSYKALCHRHSSICYNGKSPWVTPSPCFLKVLGYYPRPWAPARLPEARGGVRHSLRVPEAKFGIARRSRAAAFGL